MTRVDNPALALGNPQALPTTSLSRRIYSLVSRCIKGSQEEEIIRISSGKRGRRRRGWHPSLVFLPLGGARGTSTLHTCRALGPVLPGV